MPARDTVVCRHFPVIYKQRATPFLLLFRQPAPLTDSLRSHSRQSLSATISGTSGLSCHSTNSPLFRVTGLVMLTCMQADCRWIQIIRTAFSSPCSPSCPLTLAVATSAFGGTCGRAGRLLCCHNAWGVQRADKETNLLGKVLAYAAQKTPTGATCRLKQKRNPRFPS